MRGLFIILLSVGSALGVLIPTDQLQDWTPGTRVGVIGGIPTTRTQFVDATQPPYNADKTGVNNATSAIQGALNACPANQYVYLPAGTYKINTLNMLRDDVTLRGAGPAATILQGIGGYPVAMGPNSEGFSGAGQTITAGNSRDSTTVTIADTSGFTVGKVACLMWTDMIDNTTLGNGTTYITTSTGGPIFSGRWRKQTVLVVSKTGTTVTFFPGILHTPQTGTTASLAAGTKTNSGIGLEDLAIDGTVGGPVFNVYAVRLVNSWIKNVRSINTPNYPFAFYESVNCEVTHCFAGQTGAGGSNGSGYLLNTVSASYFYDNISYHCGPGLEMNAGSCGNVFAYNLYEGFSGAACNINSDHGPHNSHNLFEGNIASFYQSDGYFGGASQQTVFRNWFTGTNLANDYNTFGGVVLNRWNSHNSIVGNLLGHPSYPDSTRPLSFGNPNLGNASFTGSYNMRLNSFPVEWKVPGTVVSGGGQASGGVINVPSGILRVGQLYVTIMWNNRQNWMRGFQILSQSGTNYGWGNWAAGDPVLPPNGTVLEIWSGQEGFQGQDQGCFTVANNGTTTVKANYFRKTGSTGWPPEEDLGSDTIPNSLYLSAKPAFFASLSWPPFNPESPGTFTINQGYQKIPAGYRFVNGVDPPASGAPSVTAATIPSGGTTIVLTFSEAVDFQSADAANFSLSMSGGAVTATTPSGSGTATVTLTLSRTVNSNEGGSISYTQPGNGVEDLSGNDLASFSGFGITNNSTQGPLPTPTPTPTPGPGGSGSLTTPVLNINRLRVR